MVLARSSRHQLRRRRKRQTQPAERSPTQHLPPESLVDPPGIVAQAVVAGFRVDFVEGLPGGPFHYNAGLVKRPDGLWLAYREQNRRGDEGRASSRIGVCRLEGDLLVPTDPQVVELPEHFDGPHTEQREDPRLFRHREHVWMNYVAYDRVSTCGQALVRLDSDWNVVEEIRVDYGGNFERNKWQKNWAFFDDCADLRFVYMPDPHEVVRLWDFVDNGAIPPTLPVSRTTGDRIDEIQRGVAWKWGQARGGTPPVLKDGLYWSFFHSRLPSTVRRFRYFMGAYAFGARPPYRPEVVSAEPILSASRHDPVRTDMELPLVVFPCGAVLLKDEWWVSFGVNDHSTAIARISHEWLRKRMVACS